MTAILHRLKAVILPVLLFSLNVSGLWAQEEDRIKVHILNFSNLSDETVLDPVAEACFDTINLTLRLLGRYEITEGPVAPQTADVVISGEISWQTDGTILIKARAVNRDGSQSIEREALSHGFLEVFEATDTVSLDLLESFTLQKIEFSSLNITSGQNMRYLVYIDDILFGEDLQSLRLLTGTHTVDIRQNRLFGLRTIYSETRDFTETGSEDLHIPETGLLPEEESFFHDLDSYLEEMENSHHKAGEVLSVLDDVLLRLAGLSPEPLRRKKAEYLGIYTLWLNRSKEPLNLPVGDQLEFGASLYLLPGISELSEDTFTPPPQSGMVFNAAYRLPAQGRLPLYGSFSLGYEFNNYPRLVRNDDLTEDREELFLHGLSLMVGADFIAKAAERFYFIFSADMGTVLFFLDSNSADPFFAASFCFQLQGGPGFLLSEKMSLELVFGYRYHSYDLDMSKVNGGLSFIYQLPEGRP